MQLPCGGSLRLNFWCKFGVVAEQSLLSLLFWAVGIVLWRFMSVGRGHKVHSGQQLNVCYSGRDGRRGPPQGIVLGIECMPVTEVNS